MSLVVIKIIPLVTPEDQASFIFAEGIFRVVLLDIYEFATTNKFFLILSGRSSPGDQVAIATIEAIPQIEHDKSLLCQDCHRTYWQYRYYYEEVYWQEIHT